MRPLIALVAFIAGLSAAGPALAHVDLSPRAIPAAAVERDDAASPPRASGLGSEVEIEWAPAPIFAAALPEPASATGSAICWLTLAAGLAAVWLGRRTPRQAVGVVLIALLAVFAFENGLHSVHHGADKHQLASCPLSAASSHLSATVVDQVVCSAAVLHRIGEADVTDPTAPIARPISARLGRSPPTSS